MYFYGYFQTDVFINFFILLRQVQAITRENFILAKQDPGSTTERSRDETFYMQSQDVIYEEFITLPVSQ